MDSTFGLVVRLPHLPPKEEKKQPSAPEESSVECPNHLHRHDNYEPRPRMDGGP